ncbi:hypothetical protein J2S43_005829 [Catenuloplanes nepalensis]|uniref:Uncharacterized protein n=1 Tax=Catenuloplanes nepalensis TaxID=587533 RepID=A0ABT9N0T8_9ACTN|nr:DUF6232 family protein [Catenuloplanes nepalensis]MDP9797317.1 hypothetical protein [Catenuloplanes nepalensis]
MVTYYRDAAVEITSDRIVLDGRAYPLDALDRVWHRRGARRWSGVVNRGALGILMLGPLVAATFGIMIALLLRTSLMTTAAIVAASVVIGLAAVPVADLLLDQVDRSYDRGTRELELWALIGGVPVRLLHSTDARRFNQIYRALQRAVEINTINSP